MCPLEVVVVDVRFVEDQRWSENHLVLTDLDVLESAEIVSSNGEVAVVESLGNVYGQIGSQDAPLSAGDQSSTDDNTSDRLQLHAHMSIRYRDIVPHPVQDGN